MAGKREIKRNRNWIPGAVITLAVAALLTLLGGSHGVAADSPVAEANAESTAAALAVPMPILGREPAGPVALEEEKAPWPGPVAESAAVEDAYFADAVFLGDSRTDGLRLYSGLKEGKFLCLTGATVESVFTKKAWKTAEGTEVPLLDALAQEECGKIYLMLGINELGWAGTDIFRQQSRTLLERLQADHPEAEIYIQSILPVSAAQDAQKSYVNNSRIADYNQVWRELAEELELAYLEVGEVLTGEDDCLPKDLTYDGVHLNPRGCKVWLEYLRTHTVEGAAQAAERAEE